MCWPSFIRFPKLSRVPYLFFVQKNNVPSLIGRESNFLPDNVCLVFLRTLRRKTLGGLYRRRRTHRKDHKKIKVGYFFLSARNPLSQTKRKYNLGDIRVSRFRLFVTIDKSSRLDTWRVVIYTVRILGKKSLNLI